ncbi:MAG: hypothetical protein ACTHLE_17950 [Agriterribacter sp.]
MRIQTSNEDLMRLYSKAKEKYYECINYQENHFLQNEIDVPLMSIQLVEKEIKITFSHKNAQTYFLEICLTLYADNKIIGKYVYTQNELEEGINDSLVFQ